MNAHHPPPKIKRADLAEIQAAREGTTERANDTPTRPRFLILVAGNPHSAALTRFGAAAAVRMLRARGLDATMREVANADPT